MTCTYLSFAGEEGFRGACVVREPNIVLAVARAHALGINPGGEVLGFEINGDLPDEWVDRLLTADEAYNLPEPTWRRTS